MSILQTLLAAMAAISLFLHGLHGFSSELQIVGGEQLKVWLKRVTAGRWVGFLIGAASTAIVQSSSAISALTVAMVDAAVVPFRSSLGVLLGANVGTTATAWLVSFKLTGIGPFFLVTGTIWSALPIRGRVIGKAVFYFGLIFFALDAINNGLAPLRQSTLFADAMIMARTPWLGVLVGLLFTAIVQSSSVTTGLAILLVQQGMLEPQAAIPMVIGANVGSTSTALVASMGMYPVAKAAAISNFLFNVTGVLLFLPFMGAFSHWIVGLLGDPGIAVAWAHLIFNLSIALVFLATLDWVEPRLHHWLIVRE